MTCGNQKLKMANNPIKEIIFSISFAESIKMECLKRFTEISDIKQAFPVIRPGYNANLKASNDGKPPITDVKKSGYVLKCDEPCNRILQAKIGLLAFHKTKEYQSYDELLPELNIYWKHFQDCTGDLSVTSVSLRYLNFIDIIENEEIKDFINIWIESPFNNVNHSFISLKYMDEKDNSTETTIVITKGKDNNKDGVILDIILNRKIDSRSFQTIGQAFEGMRELKNEIFQKCITPITKTKYNL